MLVMDIGNTRIKWGIWQPDGPVQTQASVYDPCNLEVQLQQWFTDIECADGLVICSVASATVNEAVRAWFVRARQQEPIFVTSKKQQAGVVNCYENPQQLGVDRWIAMIAAHAKFDKNLCVISCGSALTVDLVTAKGVHQGGLIMPGITMMRRSLLNNTAGIDVVDGKLVTLADNTADAVYSGCFQMTVAGLSHLVQSFSQVYEGDLQCVVTGGDGEQVAQAMSSDCSFDGNLILYGLGLVAGDLS